MWEYKIYRKKVMLLTSLETANGERMRSLLLTFIWRRKEELDTIYGHKLKRISPNMSQPRLNACHEHDTMPRSTILFLVFFLLRFFFVASTFWLQPPPVRYMQSEEAIKKIWHNIQIVLLIFVFYTSLQKVKEIDY